MCFDVGVDLAVAYFRMCAVGSSRRKMLSRKKYIIYFFYFEFAFFISPIEGLVLLICSGVHILNVILEVRAHLLSGSKRNWSSFFIFASWFFGTPIGFILSGVDTQKLRKRNIYVISRMPTFCIHLISVYSHIYFNDIYSLQIQSVDPELAAAGHQIRQRQ